MTDDAGYFVVMEDPEGTSSASALVPAPITACHSRLDCLFGRLAVDYPSFAERADRGVLTVAEGQGSG